MISGLLASTIAVRSVASTSRAALWKSLKWHMGRLSNALLQDLEGSAAMPKLLDEDFMASLP
jgi:hypothetical protein